MTPSPTRLLLALAGCLLASPAMAAKVDKVEVKGLADAAMQANVHSALSLSGELDRELSTRRLNYLLRQAESETREALEPFGYYTPTIVIRRSDRDRPVGSGNGNRDAANDSVRTPDADADADADADTTSNTAAVIADDNDDDDRNDTPAAPRNTARNGNGNGRNGRSLSVVIEIALGRPVRVRDHRVGVEGAGGNDPSVADALAAFAPRQGEVLDHQRYEASKRNVAGTLLRHGYFDADVTAHRVEVTRADFAADIDLRWSSGERHLLGAASFHQEPRTILRDALLHKLVDWDEGEPYDQARLDRLRSSLIALDYFGLVEVSPHPEDAQDRHVPVAVNLTPAPRSIYTAGLSYGTLSGLGISGGLERRYLNSRGHKALAQVDYADKRKFATLQYRVPAFAWRDGWYTVSLQAADELTDYLNSRRLELVGSRSGQFNSRLNLVTSMHVLRERWAYNIADDGGGAMAPIDYTYASFWFPSLRAEYIDVDDRLAPRSGVGGTLTIRGGRGGAEGDATFAQLHASMQWFRGFDADSRLIVRGEAGHTFTDQILNLPPSLRYYAGGDRSVRGYGWHEIGPKVDTDHGYYFTGAANVLTASVEYERYFKGPWGAAVFVDTGDAFDGKRAGMHTGVGIGLRWRSPVGPVRIDIARGLKSPDSPFTIGLNIGADL